MNKEYSHHRTESRKVAGKIYSVPESGCFRVGELCLQLRKPLIADVILAENGSFEQRAKLF